MPNQLNKRRLTTVHLSLKNMNKKQMTKTLMQANHQVNVLLISIVISIVKLINKGNKITFEGLKETVHLASRERIKIKHFTHLTPPQ